MDPKPTARIYVDGFNLYRRCLERHNELKWLDLVALGQYLMPDYDVTFVRYFTAILSPQITADPQTPVRQQMYLRALAADSKVSIHYGKFRSDVRPMTAVPVVIDPLTNDFVKVRVRKMEEKGSDVNLATRMLADAFESKADIYVVLSNDSDQAGPLTMMKDEFSFSTGIIFPMESSRSSKELIQTKPDFVAYVSLEALAASQYPSTMLDAKGREFHRPPKWSAKPA